MRREVTSRKRAVGRQACCYWLMLSAGFLCCFLLAWLAYFTYQSAAGRVVFNSPWTYVLRHSAIWATSYYVAGFYGRCPLLRRCRCGWFAFWRFQSWRGLVDGRRPRPSSDTVRRFRGNAMYPRASPGRPLFRDGLDVCVTAARRRSAPVRTARPCTYARPAHMRTANDARVDGGFDGSSESFVSFDSGLGGHIVPMAQGRSSKPPYLPNSVESLKESSRHPVKAMDEERTVVSDLPDPVNLVRESSSHPVEATCGEHRTVLPARVHHADVGRSDRSSESRESLIELMRYAGRRPFDAYEAGTGVEKDGDDDSETAQLIRAYRRIIPVLGRMDPQPASTPTPQSLMAFHDFQLRRPNRSHSTTPHGGSFSWSSTSRLGFPRITRDIHVTRDIPRPLLIRVHELKKGLQECKKRDQILRTCGARELNPNTGAEKATLEQATAAEKATLDQTTGTDDADVPEEIPAGSVSDDQVTEIMLRYFTAAPNEEDSNSDKDF